MPHRRDIKTTAEFEAFGEMSQVDEEHQQVGNTLIPLALEAMFRGPQGVVAELIHACGDRFGFFKHSGQVGVGQPSLIDRGTFQANVLQVDMPNIQQFLESDKPP